MRLPVEERNALFKKGFTAASKSHVNVIKHILYIILYIIIYYHILYIDSWF